MKARKSWREKPAPKYPGGVHGLTKKLKGEGHTVLRKGRRALVGEYEKALFTGLG